MGSSIHACMHSVIMDRCIKVVSHDTPCTFSWYISEIVCLNWNEYYVCIVILHGDADVNIHK